MLPSQKNQVTMDILNRLRKKGAPAPGGGISLVGNDDDQQEEPNPDDSSPPNSPAPGSPNDQDADNNASDTGTMNDFAKNMKPYLKRRDMNYPKRKKLT